MNHPIESIVAATLAAAKASAEALTSREEYLAEYDAFLELLVQRRRQTVTSAGHATPTRLAMQHAARK